MLDIICFDKTGTLTDDSLDVLGVMKGGRDGKLTGDISKIAADEPVAICLATCHSLSVMDNGRRLIGDPMEVKMFEATKWILDEDCTVRPGSGSASSFNQIKQFPFNAAVARMSVVVQSALTNRLGLYAKGAPETIKNLCLAETVPEDFQAQLGALTNKGLRVISLAYKDLDSEARLLSRLDLETALNFLGFLVFENALKPQTAPVIKCLKEAGLRCSMVTGDNLLTALAVAVDCGLVDRRMDEVVIVNGSGGMSVHHSAQAYQSEESSDMSEVGKTKPLNRSTIPSDRQQQVKLAVSGDDWSRIQSEHPDIASRLLLEGVVFARMSPDHKCQLVRDLQSLDFTVGMCGDGANDCAALKAAHIGISLSEAEASVAAPFTAATGDISCVPTLIREGRCALVTSFTVFKYMALYSMIQFVSMLMLYTFRSNFGDMQFLYTDLVITTTLSFLMVRTAAYPSLVPERPKTSLLSPLILASISSQVLLVTMVQVASYFYLTTQPWFRPNKLSDGQELKVVCWETTTVFTVSCFQYLVVAVVFSRGPPFRKPIYTNVGFTVSVAVLTAMSLLLDLFPGVFAPSGLELVSRTDAEENGAFSKIWFRLVLLLFPLCNLIASHVIETMLDFCLQASGVEKKRSIKWTSGV
jgi:predicted P-type ATPase